MSPRIFSLARVWVLWKSKASMLEVPKGSNGKQSQERVQSCLYGSAKSTGHVDYSSVSISKTGISSHRLTTILSPLSWFVPKGKYKAGIKYIERFIEPFIEKTLHLTPAELEELSKSDRDFTFLHNIALFSRDPKVIRDQIVAVLLAGRDTTAATLSWAMYELSRYPQIWHKLREQVLEHIGDSRSPTYQDLKNLTYLTHTLNETLRLYPAVPYNLRTCGKCPKSA